MTSLSRRAFLTGMGAIALAGAPSAVGATTLDYRKGIAIPAYAGPGLLFASSSVMQSRVDAAVAAGVGWLRTDLTAQQASPGKSGLYEWSAFERLFGYAKAKGMRVLACLQGQCTVDGAAPSQPRSTSARDRVAALAAAAALRLGTNVDALEVGNEVNTTRFWTPRPSVNEYGSLLAAVYGAVKRVRPELPVISAGTGGVGRPSDIRSVEWYRQLYSAGWHRYFDALALHPYSGFTTTPGLNEEAALAPVRALMDSHGDAAKLIWGTETGAPTGGSYAVSESNQALIIENSWTYFRAKVGPIPGPLFFYTLDDYASYGASTDAEDYFGLRRADGTLKSAFATVRGLR